MNLTDTQRRQILRGTFPRIPLEDDVKVEPCELTIAPQVWVEVLGVHKNRKTGNYLAYRVRDFRPRFMRRGQGYTHSIALAVANEDAEAVPPEYQQELTMEATVRQAEFDREHRAEQVARQYRLHLNGELADLVKRAVKMGVDPAMVIAPIARAIDEQHKAMSRENKRAA